MADIEMPQLGETVTEGTITRWFKQVGESVAIDEVLFEVSTDKVDTEVPSPAGGTLTEILTAEGETVEVGTVIAKLGEVSGTNGSSPAGATASPETQADPPAAPEPQVAAPAPAPAAAVAMPAPSTAPQPEAAQPAPERSEAATTPAAEPEIAASGTKGKVLSPVVRRLIAEHGIDANLIQGTGLGGRISRDDVQRFIETKPTSAAAPASAAPAPTPAPAAAPAAAPTPTPTPTPTTVAARVPAAASPVPLAQATSGDTIVPLTGIRLKTGEHMVMSKAVSPHTLTAIEVDYEAVEQVRRNHGATFKEQEGFGLTYLPFISRATIDALREYPHLNASVGEKELIVHNYVNLAYAVDLDFQGLLAPVVRDADGKRMRTVARDVADIARRARSKQLSPDELSGGTFTITNAGGYGTMMQFPIINQPQVAILSTDAVKRKPVVITDNFGNESIAIHSVGILAMAWDHRAIDGAYAAAFLARIKEFIETRDWESELA